MTIDYLAEIFKVGVNQKTQELMRRVNKLHLNPEFKLTILYVFDDGEYSQTQKSKLDAVKDQLISKQVDLQFISLGEALAGVLPADLATTQQGLVVVNQASEILWQRFSLNYKDLGKAMLDFTSNYFSDITGKDMFAWGHPIPAEGDYICNDCGYILTVKAGDEFEPGMVFPTCDVCQSGEPGGPADTLDEFWQAI